MGNCPINSRSNLATMENHTVPTTLDNQRNIVVALHDYPADGLLEGGMHIGERLIVISDDGDFMMVKSVTTGGKCYIPSNFTAHVTNRWLFTGISRLKAEELLLLLHNQTGAFMIRESQTSADSYSLSVLSRNSPSYLGSVKHYRISRLQNGWFYITPSHTFASLSHLVEHYSESADGLCSLLRQPCFIQGLNNCAETITPLPMTIRRPTLNWRDVTSSMIFKKDRAKSEDSLVSEGLREAINAYLYMTESKGWDT
ncbi:src-like-adapter 2 [Aplochiton taeniatus]